MILYSRHSRAILSPNTAAPLQLAKVLLLLFFQQLLPEQQKCSNFTTRSKSPLV